MDPILTILLSYIIGIAANETSSVIQEARLRKLEEHTTKEEEKQLAIRSREGMKGEVERAVAELAANRGLLRITPAEKPLLQLCQDPTFPMVFSEWLMAGSIVEGESKKQELLDMITNRLRTSGTTPARIEWIQENFFREIEHTLFSNQVLANWRDQLNLEYLRGEVTRLKQLAEEQAGNYTPAKQEAALKKYYDVALKAWDVIDLMNLPTSDFDLAVQELQIRQLYIPLRLSGQITEQVETSEDSLLALEQERARQRQPAKNPTNAPAASKEENKSRVTSLGECLQQNKRIVTLGDPGGGKTTMLRWLATACLFQLQRNQHYPMLPDVQTLPEKLWIPVFIRCRDLSDAVRCGSFQAILTQHFEKSELLPEDAKVLMSIVFDRIANGEVILLVDGLDEINDPRIRMNFCKELERTAIRYPQSNIVVTSRVVGYREMPYRMGNGFKHGLIAELLPEDKDDFAKRWIDVTESKRTAEDRERDRKDLVEAIHSSDRIERLTGNAMMLTTLALVKRKTGKLPNNRHELYGEALGLLLNWNQEIYDLIDKKEAIPQLEYIAYEYCRQGIQRMTEEELLTLLEDIRIEYPSKRALNKRTPEKFLELLEMRSSILIRSGSAWSTQREEKRVWEFRHLTFQEYLASKAILESCYKGCSKARTTLAERIAPLAGELEKTKGDFGGELFIKEGWRETLRLTIAGCEDNDVDEALLAIQTPRDGEANASRPRAIFAAMCLAEEPNVSEHIASNIIENVINIIGGDDGNGESARTQLDAAILALDAGGWSVPVRQALLREYFLRTPQNDRSSVGGLIGILEYQASLRTHPDRKVWSAALVRRLVSDHREEVVSAALAIMIGSFTSNIAFIPELLPALLQHIDDSPQAKEAIFWALKWMFGNSSNAKHDRELTPEAVTHLLDSFCNISDEETEAIRFGADLFHMINEPRAVDLLLERVSNPSSRVREDIISVLSDFKGKGVGRALTQALNDSDTFVRRNALQGLSMHFAKIDKKLLSQYFNATMLWWDILYPIDEERVRNAANVLKLSEQKVKARYEALAEKLPLKLAWKA